MSTQVNPIVVLTERNYAFKNSPFWHFVLRLIGWRVVFKGYPTPTGVIAIYPHTSNWDFLYGVCAKFAVGIQVKVWAKDALFRIPVFSYWAKKFVGLVPVDRMHTKGMVGSTAERMREAGSNNELFWLGVAPEGTRKRIEAGWRTGFYQVAIAAKVPMGIAAFDYVKKEVNIDHFFMPTGDPEVDMAHIASVLGDIVGHTPKNMSPIKLMGKDVARGMNLINKGLF